MNFGTIFVYTIIVFFPGIMCAIADRTWGLDKNPPFHMLFLKSLGFGLLIYWILEFGLKFIGWVFEIPITFENPVWKLQADSDLEKLSDEILAGMLTALVFTIVWSYNVKYELLTKFLKNIGAVAPIDQVRINSLILDCSSDTKLTVCIWDDVKGRTYAGKLKSFEEIKGEIAVLLEDVTICNSEGKVLQQFEEFIYSCQRNDFKIGITNREEVK